MEDTSRRRCSATTRRGERCRRRATHDSDPPLCTAHGDRGAGHASHPGDEPGATAPGCSPPALEARELAEKLQGNTLSLDQEISMARICLLRVAEALEANGGLTLEQRVRLASLIFRGTSTIARLVRDRHAVSDDVREACWTAVDRTLEAVGAELEEQL